MRGVAPYAGSASAGGSVYRMKCAIEHPGCWATELGKSPDVKDLRFWAGMMLDKDRIMGSFVVRASRPIDLMAYNRYALDYVRTDQEKVGEDHVYHVDYAVHDPSHTTTIRLLFDSGCVFEAPATVDGDWELMNIVASSRRDLQKLQGLLEALDRAFKILRIKEAEGDDLMSVLSWRRHLTPRQREAIRMAFQRGFYTYPRGTKIADLALEAGLSRSTFQEHLRLAEVKLIRHLMEREMEDHRVSG